MQPSVYMHQDTLIDSNVDHYGCLCMPVKVSTAQGRQGQVGDIRERSLISGNEGCQELAVNLLQVPHLSLAEIHTVSASNGFHLLCADAARVVTLHEVVVQGDRCSLAALLPAL